MDQTEKILLISNSPDLYQQISNVVRLFDDFKNIFIEKAKTFQSGKKELLVGAYQLILLDARNQKISPLEMTIQLSAITKNTPLLILNEPGLESQAINCLKTGASDYLLFDKDLYEKIPYSMKQALDEYGLKSQNKRELSRLRHEIFELQNRMGDSQAPLHPKDKFKELFLSEAKRAQRHQLDLSCLVFEMPKKKSNLDEDKKSFNKNMNQVLPHVVRKSDFWTNLKPGIFAAILPHTNKKQASAAAQRISQEIMTEISPGKTKKEKLNWKVSNYNFDQYSNAEQLLEQTLSAYE